MEGTPQWTESLLPSASIPHCFSLLSWLTATATSLSFPQTSLPDKKKRKLHGGGRDTRRELSKCQNELLMASWQAFPSPSPRYVDHSIHISIWFEKMFASISPTSATKGSSINHWWVLRNSIRKTTYLKHALDSLQHSKYWMQKFTIHSSLLPS